MATVRIDVTPRLLADTLAVALRECGVAAEIETGPRQRRDGSVRPVDVAVVTGSGPAPRATVTIALPANARHHTVVVHRSSGASSEVPVRGLESVLELVEDALQDVRAA